MTFQEILSRLQNVKKSGTGFSSRCPSHNDGQNSLVVKVGTHKTFLDCYAQKCTESEICAALGIEIKDLFFEISQDKQIGDKRAYKSNTVKKIVAVYPYTDERGKLLYENVRFEPKDFRQRRYDEKGKEIWSLNGTRRVPYRLPDLIKVVSNGADVWLCEGEKDADNLRTLGLTASSFKNWKSEFNSYLKNAHVCIIKDHDKAGMKQADDACRIIFGNAVSLKTLDFFQDEPLPEKHGKDVSDFITACAKDEGLSNEEITERLCIFADNAEAWQPNGQEFTEMTQESDAEDFEETETRIKPFPVPNERCFYGLAGDFVRLVEPHTEASRMALLAQFLVYFGNIVGRSAFFKVEGDRQYTNCFCVLVGKTASGRKGTSFGRVKEVFRGLDQHHEKECLVSGLASGEGLLYHVRDAQFIQKKDKETGKLEEILADGGVSDKRLLVVEGEFSQVLRVQGREGNTLSSFIRNLWDTGTARSLTKNSPLRTTNAHVSLIGHITQTELLITLNEVDAANGYANRIMFFAVERDKFLPFGSDIEEIELGKMRKRIGDAIEFASDIEQMQFSNDARNLWAENYQRLETSRFGYLAKITQRASPYVLRLSCIFALLDQSRQIEQIHLETALSVWQYSEDSARYIFGGKLDNQTAEKILTALRENQETGLTRTEIRDLLNRKISKEKLDSALQSLLENGLAKCEKVETKGRAKEVWFACVFSVKSDKCFENESNEQT